MTYFEIFGKTNCVWCDRAKELLSSFDYGYTFYNIETDPDALADFKDIFYEARTVPKIIITQGEDITLINSYEDLVEWLRD